MLDVLRSPAQRIISEVCRERLVSLAEVRGAGASRRLIEARRHICTRLREERELSSEVIGRLINRDHTSVLNLIGATKAAKSRHWRQA